MASTYTNDLRLELIAVGEGSGTAPNDWGSKTNVNLTSIASAFGPGTENLGSDADATLTLADGAADEMRALYLKITSSVSLTATRIISIAPNTVAKVWIIENATTGGQSITISQGTGANVTIGTGAVKMVYTDGAGSGAAVVDALVDLDLTGTRRIAQCNINGSSAVNGVLDEDNMASNSATKLATQQSIKAYVDAQVATADTLAEVLANGNTTGGTDIQLSAGDNRTNASGDMTIDVAGDLILDAAGNDVIFKDAGTTFGQITNDSGNMVLYNSGSQMLKGLSGGSNAQFVGSVTAADLMKVQNAAGSSAAEVDIVSGGTWRLRSNPTSGTNSYGFDIVKGSAGTDVKMSIDSSGNSTFNGTITATVTDNSDVLTLKSTDADENSGPRLALTRDSGSPADNDYAGLISFNADDDGGNTTRL